MRIWKRYALAFALGASATLALPPFFVFPLLIPAFIGLLWLLETAKSKKQAFFIGWWWGFGHFTTGLYWMCIALLTDPAKFGWLIPFTLVGLNGVIAIYVAVFALMYHRVKPRHPFAKILGFASLWVLVEFARGHFFTGFPWNLIGYSWAWFDSVIQTASVVGIYGLSFITVLVALAPLAGKRAWAGVWVAFSIIILLGAWRLHGADTRIYAETYVESVRLRLVQANIEQPHKWDPRLQMSGLQAHMDLSQSEGAEGITHVLWPETAVPFALNLSRAIFSEIYDVIPDNGALLSGTLRATERSADAEVWNSMAIIPQKEGEVAYYDKHHLVPFGEFVPFRGILPIDKITPGAKDFSTGPGPRSMSVAAAPEVSPLICYEAIFPGNVVDAENRPGWMLNITNDAWFGHSTGPYQHYYMTKLRAVEEGIPLVRVANTGISAVVDAYGRTLNFLPLGEKGVLDSPLPVALAGPTWFARFGNAPVLIIMLGMLAFSTLWNRRAHR